MFNKKENLNLNYILLFLISFFFLYFLLITFNISEYNWIAQINHDEGYLLEQLILKINFFDSNRIISRIPEYGVEFFYLSAFFNFLTIFFKFSKIHIYQISLLIHLSFVILSFLVIFKLLKVLKINFYYYLIFVFTILSTPQIVFDAISLKPDLNILLLSLSLSTYFFTLFVLKEKNKYLYLFLIFLSFSFTLKGWCLPFISLLFLAIYKIKRPIFKFEGYKKILLILLIIFFLFHFNYYLYLLNNFFIGNSDINILLSHSENQFLINFLSFFSKNFLFIFIGSNLFILTLIKFIFFSKFNPIFLKCFTFFLFVWFIFVFPYISDLNIFLKSVNDSFFYTTLSKENNLNDLYLIKNLMKDFNSFKLNTLLILFLMTSPILLLFKTKNIFKNKIIIPLYTISILAYLFINFFVKDYGNHFPAKYLYSIFITIFLIILLNNLSSISKKFHLAILLIFFNSFFIFISNINIYYSFKNYFNLEENYKNISKSHDRIFTDFSNLYVCGGVYPEYKKSKNIEIFRLKYEDCFKDEFINMINASDLVLFPEDEILSSKIKNSFNLFFKDQHNFLGTYGKNQLINFFFFSLAK